VTYGAYCNEILKPAPTEDEKEDASITITNGPADSTPAEWTLDKTDDIKEGTGRLFADGGKFKITPYEKKGIELKVSVSHESAANYGDDAVSIDDAVIMIGMLH